MTNTYAVTFDIADGSFTFYTRSEWDSAVRGWRQEVVLECGIEMGQAADMDSQELIEIVYGEEVFCDFLPQS